MRGSTRWGYVSALTITLMMVLGLSFSSIASAQEARWKALYNQVMELYQKGKYREAVPVAQEALKVAEQTFGPNHIYVATSLNNLATLYEAQGQYAKAEPLFKRALAIWEKALGPDHPHVAKGLCNLALLYTSQGRYAQAEPLYKRALGIFDKTVPNHPILATLLDNLAELYIKMGRNDEAVPLLNRVRKIRLGL